MLDAVLSPGWESRYYSFDSTWGPGEEMASMRNGSGDEYSIVFSAAGMFVRGFDHESPMSPAASELGEPWSGVLDAVPEVFAGCVHEPAFSFDGVPEFTVCLWRRAPMTAGAPERSIFRPATTRTARAACSRCWSMEAQRPIGGSPRITTGFR